MAALLVLLLLTGLAGAGWFYWPALYEQLETARRRRRIERIRQRTLAEMELVREMGWRARQRQSQDRLQRIIEENDL